jgi:hypothetical protein
MKPSRNPHMHRLSVPAHPPQFIVQPWFPLTVRITGLTTTLTVSGLRTAISSQIYPIADPQNPPQFDVRLQRALFWGALLPMNSGSALPPLFVTVFDLFLTLGNTSSGAWTESDNILSQYADYPNQVSRAKVGFEYSDTHKQAVIPAASANDATIFRVTGMGTNSVVYLHLLWRPAYYALSYFAEAGAKQPAASQVADSDDESFCIDDDYVSVRHRRAASTRSGRK